MKIVKTLWYNIEGRLYYYNGEVDNGKYVFHAVYSDDVFQLSEYEITTNAVDIRLHTD